MTAYAALMNDAQAYVAITDADLIVREGSASWCRFVGCGLQDVIGTAMASLLPAPVRQERVRIMEQVLRIRQSARITGMVRGHWLQATYRPLINAESQVTGLFICGTHAMQTDADCDGVMSSRAHTHDLGPFAPLTRREFEILRLIAQGMATAEIAAHIHRSQKTVESHRRTLGQKLGAKKGAELARIATEAGLLWISDHDFGGLLEVMHNDVDDRDADWSHLP